MSGAQVALSLRPWSGRLGRRVFGFCALLLALGALYFLWLRDASVFAVKTVRVEGVSAHSAEAEKLRRALVDAGREMTTLHVRPDLLRDAASGFPLVASVRADAGFPDSLTIHVSERRPVALIDEGSVAIADDGTILRGHATDGLDLPALPLDRVPARPRLVGTALQQTAVLGAAPAALLPYLSSATHSGEGVVVELEGGIELRFGGRTQLEEKWRAAAAVLADPSLTALDYVDLTSPRRPAVGGGGHYLPAAP
jgi:cell division protein FtsQ